jgi:hypothetical protein
LIGNSRPLDEVKPDLFDIRMQIFQDYVIVMKFESLGIVGGLLMVNMIVDVVNSLVSQFFTHI